MKWVSIYLVGYVLVIVGIAMALWKVGVLERIGGFWIAVGVILAVGIGIILSISGSGRKETIEAAHANERSTVIKANITIGSAEPVAD